MRNAVCNRRPVAILAAAALSVSLASSAQAQSYLSYGLGLGQSYFNNAIQQQRQYEMQQRRAQQQQKRAAREAAARERSPHEASSSYTGNLVPLTDLQRIVPGKTIYLERPIVAGAQIVRWQTNEVYMAADGKSYSAAWSGRPWETEQNNVCLGGIAPQNCWRVFTDDAHQVFFLTSTNILLHVARVENGDSANAKTQYAQAQQRAQQQAKVNSVIAGAVVDGIVGALTSSPGNGDGACDEACRAYQLGTAYQREGVGAWALP